MIRNYTVIVKAPQILSIPKALIFSILTIQEIVELVLLKSIRSLDHKA